MQVPEDRFPTFADFWPYYVAQHLDPTCRGLHFVGTGLTILCLALGLVSSPRWFLLAPVCGYGFAWVGHFVFERNRPAAFGNPLLSLVADLRMFGLMLRGRMGPHLERARRLHSL